MLGFWEGFVRKITGSSHCSLSLFNGILVIVLIAMACTLLSSLLEIEDVVLSIWIWDYMKRKSNMKEQRFGIWQIRLGGYFCSCYPDEGPIEVLDGLAVVKFAV